MSRMRTRGASNRSSSRLSSASAGCRLFCCISPLLADTILEEAARPMHRVLLSQKLMRLSMEVLRRRLYRAPYPNDRNQCVEGFLIERLMGLWGRHDELQPEAMIKFNDLVNVVRIELLERLVHEQKGRLRGCILAATEMVEVSRGGRDSEADVERNELLSATRLAAALLKVGNSPVGIFRIADIDAESKI